MDVNDTEWLIHMDFTDTVIDDYRFYAAEVVVALEYLHCQGIKLLFNSVEYHVRSERHP